MSTEVGFYLWITIVCLNFLLNKFLFFFTCYFRFGVFFEAFNCSKHLLLSTNWMFARKPCFLQHSSYLLFELVLLIVICDLIWIVLVCRSSVSVWNLFWTCFIYYYLCTYEATLKLCRLGFFCCDISYTLLHLCFLLLLPCLRPVLQLDLCVLFLGVVKILLTGYIAANLDGFLVQVVF